MVRLSQTSWDCFCWWHPSVVDCTSQVVFVSWWFLLGSPCWWCRWDVRWLLCLCLTKCLAQTVVQAWVRLSLLEACTVLFHQTHTVVVCCLCSKVCKSLCCRLSEWRTCWVGRPHVWPAMAWLDVESVWWCRSFVGVVIWVLSLVPSVFCGTVRHCPVIASCMLTPVWRWCCLQICWLLREGVLWDGLLDLFVARCCWVLLVPCHVESLDAC